MVTYRGNAAAIPDLVSGQIDLMFVEQSAVMMGHLADGSIKTYAMLAKSRSAAMPEVLGRAEAMRRARLATIAEGGRSSHPAYWAPFVVVGEGGAGK